jgi:flagellar biosynthesis/type III secretory pathway protein FliH
MSLLPDSGLSRGSLRIEAPQGIFNGSLDRRRERIMQVILRMQEEGAS